MKFVMSKKKPFFIILGILVIVCLVAGGYFLYLQPLDEKIDRKQAELEMAEQQLTIFKNKRNQISEETAMSTMELQKKVPVKRLLEQLLLDIEKAEVLSDTTVNEIQVNGTEEEVKTLTVDQRTTNNTTKASSTTETNDQQKEQSNELTASTGANKTTQLSGMKQITIAVSGESETYFEMEEFLQSIQSLQRVTKINSLTFNGKSEITSTDQKDEAIKFDLSFSAYYFPTLNDLIEELPPLDSPDAANKKNPFSSFSAAE